MLDNLKKCQQKIAYLLQMGNKAYNCQLLQIKNKYKMYRNLAHNTNANSAIKINSNLNNEKEQLIQTVEFSALRKKNTTQNQIISRQKDNQNTLQFVISGDTRQYTILSLIGAHYLLEMHGQLQIDQQIFCDFNIQNCPKQFLTYLHPKTMRQLLITIKQNFVSLQMAAQLVNEFPITVFIIECYIRMMALNFVKKFPKTLQYGNQIQVLQNYQTQIRGHLLNVVSDSIGVNFEIQIKNNENNSKSINSKQSFGNIKNKIKIKAQYDYERQKILTYNVNRLNKLSKRPNHIQLSKRISPVVTTVQLDSKNSQKTVDTSTPDYNSRVINEINSNGECSKCHQKQKYCICRRPLQRHGRQANLDFVGLGSNVNIQINRQRKCKCNKVFCVCK